MITRQSRKTDLIPVMAVATEAIGEASTGVFVTGVGTTVVGVEVAVGVLLPPITGDGMEPIGEGIPWVVGATEGVGVSVGVATLVASCGVGPNATGVGTLLMLCELGPSAIGVGTLLTLWGVAILLGTTEIGAGPLLTGDELGEFSKIVPLLPSRSMDETREPSVALR